MKNDSLIGAQLGTYLVQSELGSGGMARVYKAYHPRLRREVAIKVILAQIADREGFQARFEREAQVVASLEHPNIVSVYDFASEGHLTYLVMQYVGGGTLRDQLSNKRPLEPQRATTYAIQMARALHHAHQRGIIHRDVKPQNMLISSADSRHLLLSDFGIAKIYQGSEDPATLSDLPIHASSDLSLTNANQLIGTADYMSPEQAEGKPVDARTDVYALGVVLYQMLTGEVPFQSTTLHGLLFQHVYTPPPSIREKNPHVPEILAHITLKSLAKSPADRFQNAEALAEALAAANSNATNPLASFGSSNMTIPTSLQTAQTSNPALSGPGLLQQGRANPPQIFDAYATRAESQVGTNRTYHTTQPPGMALPTTSPGITDAPLPLPATRKRQLPLSYILAALVLIACIAVAGIRFLPGHTGGGSPTQSKQAQPFSEHFQNNQWGWQTGTLEQGVSATDPSGGQYSVTVPPGKTAFPYPQNVGTLPTNFTLTATLQGSATALSAFYGVVLHFTKTNSGISGYAFILNNTGHFQIIRYENATSVPVASVEGTYNVSGKTTHTLMVQARGSNYTFSIDSSAVAIPTSANPANTVWSDSDLHDGNLTLFFAGPDQGNATADAIYVASAVQLSIP